MMNYVGVAENLYLVVTLGCVREELGIDELWYIFTRLVQELRGFSIEYKDRVVYRVGEIRLNAGSANVLRIYVGVEWD